MNMDEILGQIRDERVRQISREGYTTEHDDAHIWGEVSQAAAAYCLLGTGLEDRAGDLWPWRPDEFKPQYRRRNLIRAGALIVAELERLDRATTPGAARQED